LEIVIESLVEGAQRAKGTVVVIDVLRAFTSTCVAFERGVDHIVMVAEVEEALALREAGAADLCIGEVAGLKPDGFDYGNSPYELSGADLSGKVIAQSTRAGTTGVALAAEAGAERLFAGSLVNAAATVRAIAAIGAAIGPEHVTLAAMGAWGTIRSDEDEQCAWYLKNLLQGRRPDPQAVRSLVLAGEESQKYHDPMQERYHAKDLEMATRIDSVDFAIGVERRDGLLIARPIRPAQLA
jgi:2-phosphosulfolactate phosphatase